MSFCEDVRMVFCYTQVECRFWSTKSNTSAILSLKVVLDAMGCYIGENTLCNNFK